MGVACIWLAICAEKTYTPFIVGRAFLGLFEAPIEAIVPSTVTDVFYLHERGEKVSVYGLAVLGGNEIGPLVSAFIIQTLSVRWAFFIVAISIFIKQITLIFFMPETEFTGPRPEIILSTPDEAHEEKGLSDPRRRPCQTISKHLAFGSKWMNPYHADNKEVLPEQSSVLCRDRSYRYLPQNFPATVHSHDLPYCSVVQSHIRYFYRMERYSGNLRSSTLRSSVSPASYFPHTY